MAIEAAGLETSGVYAGIVERALTIN
jgi:hypothetical protein